MKILSLALMATACIAQVGTVIQNRQRLPAPEGPLGTASIEGTVINVITHEPVQRAQVTLSGQLALTANTDAAGHFAFKQLPSGTFSLQTHSSRFPESPLGSRLLPGSVTLLPNERKTGLMLSLTPGASISGRVMEEDESPMVGCGVSTMHFDYSQGGKTLNLVASATTNQNGDYRLRDLLPGKYYILAQCQAAVPLPHRLLPRGFTNNAPTQAYRPLFYPGTTEFSGAVRVMASAGAVVAGVNFRMLPAMGVSVRGYIRAAGEGPAAGIRLSLEPTERLRRNWETKSARYKPDTHEFQFSNVFPGSYLIVADSADTGQVLYARIPIDVASTSPEPFEITLNQALSLRGTLSLDDDATLTFENMQVMLSPVDNQFSVQAPNVKVQRDGSFTLTGIVPGRWRIMLNGTPGYVKSILLDNKTSPLTLDLFSAPAEQLHIAVSNKRVEAAGSIVGQSSGGTAVSVLFWPADEDRLQSSGARTFSAENGRFSISDMQPGRYYACATGVAESWVLAQNSVLLKTLQQRCTAVELDENARASLQISLIPVRELERILDDLDSDNKP